jgi:hypothetical protein
MNEKKTVRLMISLYCRSHHHRRGGHLCETCDALLSYAFQRLESCPYQPDKPLCSQCTTHCYAPQYREQMRQVMRYAGPRMIYTHPIIAFEYLLKKAKRHG